MAQKYILKAFLKVQKKQKLHLWRIDEKNINKILVVLNLCDEPMEIHYILFSFILCVFENVHTKKLRMPRGRKKKR